MNVVDLNIAVIGAGIGGAAVATALGQRGARVTVFERASNLTEIGAGLQISANGMVVLRALDVVGNVPPLAVQSTGTQVRDFRRGRHVLNVVPPEAGPSWYFHRSDLLDLLVRSAKKAGVTFELGQTICDVDPKTGVVHTPGGTERPFDLVIAATDDLLFESNEGIDDLEALMRLTERAQTDSKYFQNPEALQLIETVQRALMDTGGVGKTNALPDVVKANGPEFPGRKHWF